MPRCCREQLHVGLLRTTHGAPPLSGLSSPSWRHRRQDLGLTIASMDRDIDHLRRLFSAFSDLSQKMLERYLRPLKMVRDLLSWPSSTMTQPANMLEAFTIFGSGWAE